MGPTASDYFARANIKQDETKAKTNGAVIDKLLNGTSLHVDDNGLKLKLVESLTVTLRCHQNKPLHVSKFSFELNVLIFANDRSFGLGITCLKTYAV